MFKYLQRTGKALMLPIAALPIAGILLGVGGAFLFFFSLSGFLLKLVQSNKRFYLKNENIKVRNVWVSVFTFIISLVMIGLAYYTVLDKEKKNKNVPPAPSNILVPFIPIVEAPLSRTV